MKSTSEQDQPYRWVILLASASILALVLGQLVNGLSVYFVPLETSEGWSRADIALINSIGLLGLAVGSLVMGFAVERFGVRKVVLLGITVTGLATLAASRATSLWHFYSLFFFAGALGGGSISAPLMALVGCWFTRGAGLALGIAAAGQAVGQGGMPFTGALLIEALGWRGAMAAQGIGTIVILIPLALLLRDAPIAASDRRLADQTPSGLPNTMIVAWMSLAVVFCCTCMAVPLMHLVPLMQGRDIAATDAGSVLFVMLMIAIVGRVAFGRLADIIGALPAWFAASAWQTALVFGFVFLTRLDHFYIYAAIYGFGYAGVMTGLLVTIRSLTSPARRASSTGIVLAFAYVGHGLGGWQGGLSYDLTGNYSVTYANAALAGLVNLVIVGSLWMHLRGRRAPVIA